MRNKEGLGKKPQAYSQYVEDFFPNPDKVVAKESRNKSSIYDRAEYNMSAIGFPPTYIALLHFPILNRHGVTVTTSVTNLDIHDISRIARTYGILKYFIVTPVKDQLSLVEKIISHWNSDQNKQKHPDRFEALSIVKTAKTFFEVRDAIFGIHDQYPEVVFTDARTYPHSVTFEQYRAELASKKNLDLPRLIVFGTGWGICPKFYQNADKILTPIFGPKDQGTGGDETQKEYNHLPVRAASSVILDRLFGRSNSIKP